MAAPLIGVATNASWVATYGALSRHVSVMTNANIQPLVDAGTIPLLMPNFLPHADIPALVARLDGILFPGGQDIDPSLYGEEQKVVYTADAQSVGVPYARPRMMAPDRQRDLFELAVYAEAKKQGKPVMGICRGLQLINVAEGGSLHQEVSEVATVEHEIDHSGYSHHHEIHIAAGSFFHSLFKREVCFGPSTHHQALKRIGDKLVVSGRAVDGVAEFVEYAGLEHFIVGVQGDIERARRNLPEFDSLYRRFAYECQQRMSGAAPRPIGMAA
ncbi:gamma-glutamyl-gamma-aminobutyrate hydrolase family protein [Massilia sp. erpn]|uniref:gamma-glutamyl-gamma-aminobutyrate hydrolase family protein n=1 Tax=Massilia sp. erpn TaxID=2738142 RepID=UPI0021081A88|nr:gamma-glutamyl-gamma-aminobutyrate hydrolase family protein [Massilia sp. erpn]UTY57067.1 gamma-glutamyl-gamma-aminobutyrate hydrolase family protein [Massilia sp. erpn]